MAKGKASKEGNDIGVDLANNMAKAITRVLSTYDFSPLNKNITKGIGTVDISSLLKSNNAKIKQLATDIKSSLEKGVGDIAIAPTLDITPLEKAGDLVRTLINLTDQANKKTTITTDLYKKITDVANKLVASKRMEKDAAEDIAKAYQVKLPPLKLKTEIEKVDTKAIEAQTSKLKPVDLKASISSIDTTQIGKLDPIDLKASIASVDTSAIKKQLPTAELKAVVGSVDTKAIDDQVKKIDLIGLQALVTEVDTSLVQEEVNKLNPLAFTSQVSFDSKALQTEVGKVGTLPLQAKIDTVDTKVVDQTLQQLSPANIQAEILAPDSKPFEGIVNAQQESIAATQQQTQATSQLEAVQNRVLTSRFDEAKPLADILNMSRLQQQLEQSKLQPAKEFIKFLKEGKITYQQLGTLVGLATDGQGKLNRSYEDGEQSLQGILSLENQVERAIKQSGQAKAIQAAKNIAAGKMRAQLDSEEYKQQLNALTEDQKRNKINQDYASFEKQALSSIQQTESQRYAKAIGSRRELISILQEGLGLEELSQGAIQAINESLQDGTDLIDAQAASIGATGKSLEFVKSQLKANKSLDEIRNSTAFKALQLAEKENEKVKERYVSQRESIQLQEKLKVSYANADKLLESTLQHSNLLFFKQVDVKQALEDQKRVRQDIIQLAAEEGAAGDGARALLQAEVDLFKQQVELEGHSGAAAAYVVEQLAKGRDITAIQRDQQLEVLEAQEKSIDFRKKDLELQLLTKKRIHEIKESHEKIKDKIKQTLDFSKELAKDPKAFGAFAAATIGVGLGKAVHQLHELMDLGMSAGGAFAVMRENITLMSVLGLSKVGDVNKELMSQFGTMEIMTDNQRDSIGKMAASYGLAGDEATKLGLAISRMPGESMETAANFSQTAESVASMAGVDTGVLMKEIAKNSGLMATYSKGGAEGFAKAAASAKKMGLELNSVLSAAEKTLDFESSINAQMEASVLTGKSLNFDRLRAAALAGDANAIMQEQASIMQQVGNLDNMNVLQKKKLAEAMGMTVEEMTKFNEAQQFQNKYFGASAGPMDKFVGTTIKIAGAIGGAVKEYGMQALAIAQFMVQLATLRAMKAANTAATVGDTASLNANTTSQIANANASKLNAAQMQVFKTLRAADLPAQAAMTAARNLDTASINVNANASRLNATQLRAFKALRATDMSAQQAMAIARGMDTTSLATNTGAQQLNQTATQKGILVRIQDKVSKIGSALQTAALTALTNLATAAENFYTTAKQKGILVAAKDLVMKTASRVASLLNRGALFLEMQAENLLQGTKQRGILASLRALAVRAIERVDRLLGISNLYKEITAENALQNSRLKGIFVNLREAATTTIRTVGKLFGINVLQKETQQEILGDTAKKRSIATTITQTAQDARKRVQKLLGIATINSETLSETNNDAAKKRGLGTTLIQIGTNIKNRVQKLLGIGVTNLETQSEIGNDTAKKRSIGTTLLQMGTNLKNRIQKLLGIGTTTAEITAENLKDTTNKRSIGTTLTQMLTEGRKRLGRLLGIGTTTAEITSENLSGATKQRNMGITSMQTLRENARRLGRLLGIGVTTAENTIENTSTATKGRGILATVALNAVTLTRNLLVGAGNVILGLANGLLMAFGVNTATAGTAGATASPGLVAFGIALGTAGAAAAPAIPIILAFGAAILLATPAIYVLGEVLKAVATVIGNVLMKALEMLPAIIGAVAAGFAQIFTVMAQNWQILIPVGLGLTAVGAGLMVFGAGAAMAMPGILALTAAMIVAGPTLLALATIIGDVLIKAMEKLPAIVQAVSNGFAQIFAVVAQNWQILIPLGAGLMLTAVGLGALAVASRLAAPGVLALGVAFLLMTPALMVIQGIINSIPKLTEPLIALANVSPALLQVGGAMVAIGAGLGVMALAGIAAMPVIGALIGLAAVAPALASLGGMFGVGGEGGGGGETKTAEAGGGADKQDKMDILIEEIRGLKAEMAKGGVVNMDGRKVGDVLRLAMNTSGVR